MTWTRISDDFTDQPQVIALSDAAFRLHVEALVYSNRVNSDGLLTVAALSRLTRHDVSTLVSELLGSGLWEAAGDCVQITDWTGAAGQLAAEEVERKKAQGRERQDRSRKHRTGDHSTCVSSYCSKAPVTRDSRVSDGDPSPPFPSLPHQGKRKEKGNSATDALAPLGALDADAQKVFAQSSKDFQLAAAALVNLCTSQGLTYSTNCSEPNPSGGDLYAELSVHGEMVSLVIQWATHTESGEKYSEGPQVSAYLLHEHALDDDARRALSKLATLLEGVMQGNDSCTQISYVERVDRLPMKVGELVSVAQRLDAAMREATT